MKFTIFTPTYNRRDKLIDLYNSLEKLTSCKFEWLIVDDGSNDGTNTVVDEFRNKNKLEIRYFYQENLGKQSAYNRGIKEAISDVFICVDSDDVLTPYALDVLSNTWMEFVIREKDCCGIIFLDADENNEIIGTRIPGGNSYETLPRLYLKHGMKGDKGIAFDTNILKKYSFPIQEGEKFITEDVLYNRISERYKFYCLNEVLELRRYQDAGLSSKYSELLINNPLGSALYFNELNIHESKFLKKVINNARYFKFAILADLNIGHVYRNCYFKQMRLASLLIGYVLRFKIRDRHQ